MRDFSRVERVGAEMQRELAQLLRDQVNDPRLASVTIQEVRVVRDLSHAKIYFTQMDPTQHKQTEQALNKAAGFLRRKLGEVMTLRQVPQLKFVYDQSLETGLRISSLIDEAIARDKGDG